VAGEQEGNKKEVFHGIALLGVCFLREAPERAIEPDRRRGKGGIFISVKSLECQRAG
jgi:hypothetical protein